MPKENVSTETRTAPESPASLCSRILAREEKIDQLRLETAAGALRTIREVIAQGHDLIQLHGRLKQSAFDGWLKLSFPKNPVTAKRYMIAAAKSDGVNFLENEQFQLELFRVSGLIPEPPRADGQAAAVLVPPIIQRLNFLAEWATREADAILAWETPRLLELDQRLAVAVQLRAKIQTILQNRQ